MKNEKRPMSGHANTAPYHIAVFKAQPVGKLSFKAVIVFGHPSPEVIKLFSSSAQLSMKFQLRISVEIVKLSGNFRFKTQKLVLYPAHKC